MRLQVVNSCLHATLGLQQLATSINDERNVLVEYASKPNSNKLHIDRRNVFLQTLTETYNLLLHELQQGSKLRMLENWVLVEQELNNLLKDPMLNGVYINLKVSNGNNYGYINL